MSQAKAGSPEPGRGAGASMVEEIWSGLSGPQKRLPAKYLYDARGSALFEAITTLPEYYLTRSERAILRARAPQIAAATGQGAAVVEFGSAGAAKAKILIEALTAPAAYVPIDVSSSALEANASDMRRAFPSLSVQPVCADFTAPLPTVLEGHGGPTLLLFLGSSIGNFTDGQARELLAGWRRHFPGALMLVGADLDKEPERLLAAYDDAQGVTAAFNRNLLSHLNATLNADFNPEAFAHRARYRSDPPRIEMHLEARRDHKVTVAGRSFTFMAGETIHTESSYKHAIGGFTALAKAARWHPLEVWLDPEGLFSLHFMVDAEGARATAL